MLKFSFPCPVGTYDSIQMCLTFRCYRLNRIRREWDSISSDFDVEKAIPTFLYQGVISSILNVNTIKRHGRMGERYFSLVAFYHYPSSSPSSSIDGASFVCLLLLLATFRKSNKQHTKKLINSISFVYMRECVEIFRVLGE